MRNSTEARIPQWEEIRVLVFSLMGTKLGVDMEQVCGILNFGQAEKQDVEWVWFHERVPFRAKSVTYTCPVILLTRSQEGKRGILIDQPEEIDVPVRTDAIQPLPPLIERCIRQGPVWGVTLRNDAFVFLADLYKFWESKKG